LREVVPGPGATRHEFDGPSEFEERAGPGAARHAVCRTGGTLMSAAIGASRTIEAAIATPETPIATPVPAGASKTIEAATAGCSERASAAGASRAIDAAVAAWETAPTVAVPEAAENTI
jgi:hypothetical protein